MILFKYQRILILLVRPGMKIILIELEIDVVSENSTTIIQKIEIDLDTNYFEFNISFSLTDRLINSEIIL